MTRLRCIVPGCKRSRGQRKGEPPIEGHWQWVCHDHWTASNKQMRRALNRAQRDVWREPCSRNRARAARLWRRMTRHVIERAMGIG